MMLKDAITQLELAGKPVCIHSSLRSFGCKVEGLLESFLDAGCTVLVPTFSDQYEAPPVPEYMPEQNGAGDYSYFFTKEYENMGAYTPDSNLLSVEDMGRFPQMVLEHAGRARGDNALNSFAAIGPLAQMLISGQTNDDVYAPLQKLYELDGYVLLMGTDLTTATAIHYAEQMADRMPFVRWARGEKGTTIPVRAGGCSEGFEKLAEILKPYEIRTTVHNSLWRCYRVRDLVDVCATAFCNDPYVAHCGDAECSRCNDAAKGGPKG